MNELHYKAISDRFWDHKIPRQASRDTKDLPLAVMMPVKKWYFLASSDLKAGTIKEKNVSNATCF